MIDWLQGTRCGRRTLTVLCLLLTRIRETQRARDYSASRYFEDLLSFNVVVWRSTSRQHRSGVLRLLRRPLSQAYQ